MLLILLPNHQITNFFVQSVIVPLLLAVGYAYLSYGLFIERNIFDGFDLYSGLDGLYAMFSNEALLLIFWLHFLSISLFTGAWIVRDGRKYFIPKIVLIPSLILTYFTGPIGLVIYWFLRICEEILTHETHWALTPHEAEASTKEWVHPARTKEIFRADKPPATLRHSGHHRRPVNR